MNYSRSGKKRLWVLTGTRTCLGNRYWLHHPRKKFNPCSIKSVNWHENSIWIL